MSRSKSHRSGGNSWWDKRNYRRIYDENGNVVANIITVDGVDVEVTEEVFRAYSQMDRRERYLCEDSAAGRILSLEQLEEDGYQPKDIGMEVVPDVANSFLELEESQMLDVWCRKLNSAMKNLPSSEYELLEALYVKKISAREYSRMLGVSDMAVRKQRDRVLKKILGILLK